MNVFILATVRNPELLPYTELVFKTLRIGFPSATITVCANGDVPKSVCDLAKSIDCRCAQWPETIHHKWIESLIETQQEPFYVVDTDINFYSSMERFTFTTALAGWRIPEWKDEFTNTITRSRLHGSLLYIDPVQVRQKLKEYDSQFPDTPFNPRINPFYPVVLPFNRKAYFYDTCGLLYHAIGGQAFTDEQLDSYFHFNCGTISDIVIPRLSNANDVMARRKSILANPELGRGAWREQMYYFKSKVPIESGKKIDIFENLSQEDIEQARKWNVEMCRGNQDAMGFNDLFYRYCHLADDLVDSMQDGRPVMSKEQIISLLFNAAAVYNCKFFVANRDLLFPIALQITNTWADSVAWENSPKAHLRVMGDVFRTCGNEMYIMVALICGGEAHMRNMSMKIKERDWISQHNSKGEPI